MEKYKYEWRDGITITTYPGFLGVIIMYMLVEGVLPPTVVVMDLFNPPPPQ